MIGVDFNFFKRANLDRLKKLDFFRWNFHLNFIIFAQDFNPSAVDIFHWGFDYLVQCRSHRFVSNQLSDLLRQLNFFAFNFQSGNLSGNIKGVFVDLPVF
ncbi:hypothetical protein D3C72_1676660 [compost metagenome]